MSSLYKDKSLTPTQRRPPTTTFRVVLIFILLPTIGFASFAIYLLIDLMGTLHINSSSTQDNLLLNTANKQHFTLTAPQGYFRPSLSDTNPPTFDPTTTNFGLIHKEYPSDSSSSDGDKTYKPTDWERFAHHIHTLNKNSSPDKTHHVFFLSRHGQGYHNLAESYYGTDAWDCHFAELDGDPEPGSNITWVDAELSKLGKRQAGEQAKFWKSQYEHAKMPRPNSWWVSPMERACRTAQITHGFPAAMSSGDGRKVTVKEFLRETNGIHTCDQRGLRSGIAERYPGYMIEQGFTEVDQLWDPIYRETDEAHTYRAKLLLDDILGGLKGKDKGEFLSFTAHGGMINALLRAVGHREFSVQVGSAIAIYVVAERVAGSRPEEKFQRGGTKPVCKTDPLKAGLPGYKSLREYVEKVEASVEADM